MIGMGTQYEHIEEIKPFSRSHNLGMAYGHNLVGNMYPIEPFTGSPHSMGAVRQRQLELDQR